MTERIRKIVAEIPSSRIFGDIGCDHGYAAEYMLKTGKCKVAIISDISEKCLDKARKLLKKYEEKGRVKSVVTDGFTGLPKLDTALIAGMGGEEIVAIMKNAEELPENLVLQPMKNCDKVRVFAVCAGYRIEWPCGLPP